jgi:hypothetical protein
MQKLDNVLSLINSARAEAPSRRQALVDETRALRSLEPEARPARIGSVMKVFQKHVDWLTERAKLAEDALLEQQLSTGTSSFAALQEAAARAQQLEAELQASHAEAAAAREQLAAADHPDGRRRPHLEGRASLRQ